MSPSAGANLPTVGFQHRTDAERFLKEFLERLAKFGLELHPDKTRLIEFGRFAARNRRQRGEGKPETFTFLGLTHYCGQRIRQMLSLSGSGIAGSAGPVTITPSVLNFLRPGDIRTVTLTNSGTTPLWIGAITLSTSNGPRRTTAVWCWTGSRSARSRSQPVRA
jgi:hypothetical protein